MDAILVLLIVFLVGFILFMLLVDSDLTLLFYHYLCSPKDFRGQVVWITGASSGIGEYVSYTLVKKGAKLVLSGTNIERLENVKKRCIEMSACEDSDILLVPFEIQNYKVHDECLKKVLDHFGHIDILVNNAGVSQRCDFQNIEIEADLHIFSVNVFGAVNLTRKVLKHFLERKKGHVVAVSSIAGKLGAPFSSGYTGSKHAMQGYFEGLRSEMLFENVGVTIVCPGPVFSRIIENCVTGKVGEVHNQPSRTVDKRMKTERCSDLVATAIAHKLDECWISTQPILAVLYFAQYTPSFFRNVLMKIFFSKKRIMQVREGR